ncbi:hypothetical protein Tco_0573607 [Tanacetum coccineum]
MQDRGERMIEGQDKRIRNDLVDGQEVEAIGLIPSWNWMAAMVSRGFRAIGQLIGWKQSLDKAAMGKQLLV